MTCLYLKRAALLSCAFVLAAPEYAAAQTSRLYFAGYLGLTKYDDLNYSDSLAPASGDIKLDNANSFAGALGVRFSRNLRVEAELSYRTANLDTITIESAGIESGVGGEIETYLGLLNVYYDFDVDRKIQPFLTAGAGIVMHDGNVDDSTGFASDASDSHTSFAWQLGAGAKYRVSPGMAFTGSYRYLDSLDIEFDQYKIDYSGHEFRVGIEYDLPVN